MKRSKKTKLVGVQEYINPSTGEIVPMQVVSVEDRDFDFHKLWLKNLVNSLDFMTNQKLKLTFWIIEHIDRENRLIMTQRKIIEETGISLRTVANTMKALQESDPPFLIKISSGVYQVNPKIIWKGSHGKRMGVIYDYDRKTKK